MSGTKLQRGGTAYSPFMSTIASEVEEMRDRVRRLFGEPFAAFTPGFAVEPVGWFPATEISETQDEYIVTLDLPGMTKQDVTVEFENGALTIQGKREEERKEEQKDTRYHLYERAYGSFQRSFTFPTSVMPDDIKAEFADGVLKVRLPKAPEAKAKSRKIEIAAGK